MRPRLLVFMLAGLLMFTVIASPQTEVKAAVNSELVLDQGTGFQFHTEQSYDFANPVSISYFIMAFDVAYLPWGPDPILSESEIILDVASPVPRSLRNNESGIKLGMQKVNRMKQSL